MATNMGVVAVIFLFSLVASSNAETSNKIGINYGQLGDNLPSPYRSIQILQSMNTGRVKLYDANPEILRLLAGTKIQVSVMVPNNEINNIASNQTIAHNWVRENVLQYYPNTMIRFILVGNEILSYSSDQDKKIWSNLVPAMRKIKNSLRSHNIQNIKVGTPLAMDVLQTTSPPSNGTFRSDISGTVILPLLKFLNGTKSFFFIDVYPYFPFSSNPTSISLDYALFKSSQNYTDLRTGLIYHNLLDQMLDSLVFAMTKLNYSNIRLAIAETGWPNAGDLDQPGANIYNAATYNRNLIKKMTAKPPIGTPARPGVVIPTFIFSLYNENRKTGPGTERHWGLLNANGTAIYEIDLSGKQADSEYRALPQPNNNKPYKGKLWCIAAQGADLTELGTAVTFACSQGNGTCDALAPGGKVAVATSMDLQSRPPPILVMDHANSLASLSEDFRFKLKIYSDSAKLQAVYR
ncbi:Glucan endo-1,3-beta-glucosidase precursor, putative [Ricinus communis]|uniref:glucan endo-1,3-beta-D-glucosidase n=1 Tax=Ricinus communis TaxID=3988 RepID=B9S3Q3_RICCO|nr:Glucan endo-1,3-beta-glucosidase precursor, putative [Ricinus communis]